MELSWYQASKYFNDLSTKAIRDMALIILETRYQKRNGSDSLNEAQKREARAGGKTLLSFRHSFAVKIWVETDDIYKIKELLRHVNVATTYRYYRFPVEYS